MSSRSAPVATRNRFGRPRHPWYAVASMTENDSTIAPRVVLLAAEGMAELDGESWLRDALEPEKEAFRERHKLTRDELRELLVDKTGRPYWMVTLADDAPEVAKRKAEQFVRVRSLVE